MISIDCPEKGSHISKLLTWYDSVYYQWLCQWGRWVYFLLSPPKFIASSHSSYECYRLALWLKRFCSPCLSYLIYTYPFVTTWQDKEPGNFYYALKFWISVQLPFALLSKLIIPWNFSISVLLPFLQLFSSSFSWLSSCNMSHMLPNRTRPELHVAVLFFSGHAASKSLCKTPPSHNSEVSTHFILLNTDGDGYVKDKKEY